MERRSFLKRLAIGVAGVATGTTGVKAIAEALSTLPIPPTINPAWINAPYEIGFLFGADAFERLARPSPYLELIETGPEAYHWEPLDGTVES